MSENLRNELRDVREILLGIRRDLNVIMARQQVVTPRYGKDRLLTIKEVCQMLRCSRTTFERTHKFQLRSYVPDHGRQLIPLSEVEELLETRREKTAIAWEGGISK